MIRFNINVSTSNFIDARSLFSFLLSFCFILSFSPIKTVGAQGSELLGITPNMERTVSEIMPDGSLLLEGGVEIVLSGIRWWTLFGGDNQRAISPKELLESYTSTGAVKVFFEATPKDRYGRLQAIVVSGEGTNIQQDLLRKGLAMFWPNSGQNDALRQAESQAREERSGRWGWSSEVVKCHNWQGFWSEGMAIIKGRVKEVKVFDKITYMNFGEEWWRDFTIKIDKKWLEENNLQAESYLGQFVEIRGWLYWQGGPQILLEHKAQIAPLGEEGGRGDWALCPPLEGAS